MKLLPLLIALTLSTPAIASIDSDLGQYFDGLNYNTTNPQAYKGQAANYYTGGSALIYSPVVFLTLTVTNWLQWENPLSQAPFPLRWI